MVRSIPLPQTDSNFEIITDLDGEDFRFVFLWNDRISRWSVTLYDSGGTQIYGSRIVTTDRPLYYRDTTEVAPSGEIWFIDTTGEKADPGLRDLGRRHQMMYVDEESVI